MPVHYIEEAAIMDLVRHFDSSCSRESTLLTLGTRKLQNDFPKPAFFLDMIVSKSQLGSSVPAVIIK